MTDNGAPDPDGTNPRGVLLLVLALLVLMIPVVVGILATRG